MDAAKLLLDVDTLPPAPPVMLQISRKAADPDCKIREIEELIAKDPILAARLIRMANSAYYARIKRATTIRDAVVTLGLRTVRAITMASAVRGLYGSFSGLERTLWEHSLCCAVAARTIAEFTRYPLIDTAYVCGLCHDIGKAVMLTKVRPLTEKAIQAAIDKNVPSILVEQKLFGFDHTAVGRALGAKWEFPQEIIDGIGWHHNPQGAKKSKTLPVVVHFADSICYYLGKAVARRSAPEPADTPGAKFLRLSRDQVALLLDEISRLFEEEVAALE